MHDGSKFVGLDVHKETIAVSIAEVEGVEVRYYGEIKNTPEAISRFIEGAHCSGPFSFSAGVRQEFHSGRCGRNPLCRLV